MQIIFRTDSSIDIGTGHVMRCLALADEFASKGAKCEFICRNHTGNVIELIRSKGYFCHILQVEDVKNINELFPDLDKVEPAHLNWLGSSQINDAKSCVRILSSKVTDLLILDHYSIDFRWEREVSKYVGKLMVIDDLADRKHSCDLLLDQSFGRNYEEYMPLVPYRTKLLCGSQYALLRPEFSLIREYSINRRINPKLQELLINLGGVDKDNITGKVLQALDKSNLPNNCKINIVMGMSSPWVENIRKQAQKMSKRSKVYVGVDNMAELMAKCDLAIGAAGSTSWERCCLGLPSIALEIAKNQTFILSKLHEIGAISKISFSENQFDNDLNKLIDRYKNPIELIKTSKIAANITDGLGTKRVVDHIYE